MLYVCFKSSWSAQEVKWCSDVGKPVVTYETQVEKGDLYVLLVRFISCLQVDVICGWHLHSVETRTVMGAATSSPDVSFNSCSHCSSSPMTASVKGLFLEQGMTKGRKILVISVRSGARHVSSHAEPQTSRRWEFLRLRCFRLCSYVCAWLESVCVSVALT